MDNYELIEDERESELLRRDNRRLKKKLEMFEVSGTKPKLKNLNFRKLSLKNLMEIISEVMNLSGDRRENLE